MCLGGDGGYGFLLAEEREGKDASRLVLQRRGMAQIAPTAPATTCGRAFSY
jgi:hypothetical protein